MKTPKDKPEVASGDGMTTDTAGNYYVTSAVGVQVFAANGEWLGMLPKPGNGPLTSVGFAGTNRDIMYVTCGDKLFSRKTNTQGALFFQKP
jgi:gluconolactonase